MKLSTIFIIFLFFIFFGIGINSWPEGSDGNHKVVNFGQAKKLALEIHRQHQETIYCPCKYSGKTIDLKSCNYKIHKDAKRAARLEWEHVVAAESFGRSFPEWREGGANCVKKNGKRFKGRKCAQTNPDFSRMEADLYNIWPIDGELNGLRSNYSMAAISGEALSFGGCTAKIADRKFEPMDEFKGIVARDHMYFDLNYPGRGVISDKNKKLFEAWDKQYPVTAWECERAARIKAIQGNTNQILELRCGEKGSEKNATKLKTRRDLN